MVCREAEFRPGNRLGSGREYRNVNADETSGNHTEGCDEVGRMKLPQVSFGTLLVLWWGKLRRAVATRVLPWYTRHRHELRRGQCKRCGTCCQLGWVCPYLEFDVAGLAACNRYGGYRDPSCRVFPTTEADLRDVQRVRPEAVCGFRFVEKGASCPSRAGESAPQIQATEEQQSLPAESQ